ncbi:hypothetical protein MVG78_17875 [Roseomonas gilardii subsp. gilardii]|uniref:hypothetical protein n=1 Tax=Roseomonas gilardii TaxID=257708 RepID=UPI001FF72123|nr:hypothetical protein [Roseomonas gilardii]UPG72345.1 hypothetical protein MVG78_17875 [Roseomonas gilardii subsp. gilardii]
MSLRHMFLALAAAGLVTVSVPAFAQSTDSSAPATTAAPAASPATTGAKHKSTTHRTQRSHSTRHHTTKPATSND